MRAPTLRQVEGDLTRIAEMAPKLAQAARWAWPMAWARRHGEEPRVDQDVVRPVEAAAIDVRVALVRQNVAQAGVLIGRAAQLLELANGCLYRAQEEAESSPPRRVERPAGPQVSQAELRQLRAAKARREARRPKGMGHGEY